ncbi:hypothetical protein HY837_03010, partial [archaeon]|nr:hypothetical protein [archaeon]
WLSEYRRNGLAIVRGEIGKKKFLSLGYIGHLPGTSCGINNYGLAYTGNSLESEGLNYGVPRNILLRSLLEAKTIEEAERIATYRKRSICFNTMLVKNSTMLDIESLWKSHEVFYGEDWIVHTNHPLKEAYQNSKNTHEESVERQCEAEKYFSNEQNYSLDALKKILKSHKTGICTHKNIHHSTYGVTIASVIMNPSKGWMEVCHSNPCKHGYKLYKL